MIEHWGKCSESKVGRAQQGLYRVLNPVPEGISRDGSADTHNSN
jgi:hypothetical protein